jgi:hypothetical protein
LSSTDTLHSLTVVAPCLAVVKPSRHAKQRVDPPLGAYDPRGQMRQLVAPSASA